MAYDKEERVVPESEAQAVKKWLARIERAKERQKWTGDDLKRMRSVLWGTSSIGDTTSDADKQKKRVNMVFATQATLLPHIYAKNPEFSCAPSEAVGEDEYDHWKKFGQTAQVFIDKVLVREAELKRRAKSNVRSTMTTSVGWLKLSFQENLRGDPIIINRVNDMQENLQRMEYLISRNRENEDPLMVAADRDEIQQQIAAMKHSNEVKVFKGFALDRVQTEDILILDETVIEFDEYKSADAIAHRVWMSDETFEQTFGCLPSDGTQAFNAPSSEGSASTPVGSDRTINYREVFEVWHKGSGTIYTVATGAKSYCREPFVPTATPQRWYPFYCLGFNLVEGRWRPLSDVELLEQLDDEYNHTRHLYAEARKEAIPVRVFRKAGGLTEEDIKALVNRRSRQFIGVEGNPQVPLNQELFQFDGVAIDPAAYDVTIIRSDMDLMVGLSDASRANLVEAKTATEAEIMRQALMTRVAERQDTNEDLISEMGTAVLEIGLQRFTREEIVTICGSDALWMEDLRHPDQETQTFDEVTGLPVPQTIPGEPLSMEDVFHKIGVEVRAGSTGRPNEQKEREAWTNLLPVINDTLQQVMELRMAGQFDIAESKIELLRETLRRFDEHLDIDSIIPPMKKDEQGNIVAGNQAMQQAQQMAEQNQALTEENEKLKEEMQKLQTQLQIAKNNDQTKAAEAEARGAIEHAQAQAKNTEAVEKAETERERQRQEFDQTEKIAMAQAGIDLRKHIATTVADFVKTAMQPEPPIPGGEGKPAKPGKTPKFSEVMKQAQELREMLEDSLLLSQ